MPSESIPEEERQALARALRHVSAEDKPERTPENQEEIARLFGDEAEAATAEPTKEEGEGKPKFRLLHVLIGLLVLACLALVVPLAMDFLGGDDSGEVPVIQSEQQPDKVRPEEPGGLQVPHQDLQVLNQDAEEGVSEPVERLLPPPETPEPLAQATEDVVSPGTAPSESTEAAPTEAPAAPATEETTTSAPAAPAEVAEVPTAPMAESTAGPSASQEPEAATPAPSASVPEPAAPAAPAAVEVATPEPEAVEPPSPAKPAAPAESQQAALPPKAEPAPAAATGGIYIQLGSLTNRDGVTKEWARLQKAFPDFLGDMDLAVQTVTLEGRGTFHRIQAGPLPNRGTAEEMCAFLKDAKQACIVVKR